MMWGNDGNMGWSWLFGLLLLAGIVLLIVLAVRVFSGANNQRGGSGVGPVPGPSRARQILDERYARGELTAEQYRVQVQVLDENR